MLSRILGIITLRASAYREVAADSSATGDAFLVFVVSNLIYNICAMMATIERGRFAGRPVRDLAAVLALFVLAFLAWLIATWVLAFLVKVIFRGKTNTLATLRVTGFVHAYDAFGVLFLLALASPALVTIALILQYLIPLLRLVGYSVGAKEAAGLSAGKAFVSAFVAELVEFLIYFIAGGLVLGLIAQLFRTTS